MGAADYPLDQELPILSKLQGYGYAEDTETPTLLAPILESMDTKGLWLLERLVSDLADFSDNAQGLKDTVSDLKTKLEQEKQITHNLKVENARLTEENKHLREQIDELEGKEGAPRSSNRAEEEEEQLRQWRTQSLHQLQELERMNQALRAALSRHTCTVAVTTSTSTADGSLGKEKPCGGHIMLSQVLAPTGTVPPANVLEAKPPCSELKNHTNRLSDKCQEPTEESTDKLEDKHDELQKLLLETQEELSAKNREIDRLSALVDASSQMLQTAKEGSKEKADMRPSKEAEANTLADKQKIDGLELMLRSLQDTVKEQEGLIHSLRSQLAQKLEQLSFITDEKAVGEEALGASQLECKQLSSLMKELDERMGQLQTALEARTSERDSSIAAEKRATEARQLAEEGLQKERNDLSYRLQELQAQYTLLQKERDEYKRKEEEARTKSTQLVADLKNCQKQLELTERDLEQLKGLITRLDSTREELVEKLKMTMADRLATENQVASLEIDICRLYEETNIRSMEIAQLHTLLEAVGKERDHLSSEMQLQVERVSQLNDDNNRMVAEVRSLRRSLECAEHQLHNESLSLQKAESEALSLKEKLCMEESSRKAAEDRCTLKAVELETLTEHLNSTTTDFKLVKTQLVTAITERDSLVEDLKSITTRLSYCEQVICAKEEEEKVVSSAYDKLVEEHQQLKLAAIELDAQVQQLTCQLENTEELLKTTQDHTNFLEEECGKLKDSLREMEKQMEKLSASLAQQSSLLDTIQREKTALLSQVSSSKQINLELEGKITTLIRELAASESNNQLLMSMMQGKVQEAESFATRYRMEHERVRELEQLLACFRAQEHQLQLESKDSGAKTAILKERLAAMEEQIRLLQRCKESQRQEVMRLTALLKEKSEEENRKFNSFHQHSNGHGHDGLMHDFWDSDSKSKLQELELKTMSLAADLSKTAALYKDCFSRLQRAEAQCAEQRSEYDHVLSILSKVDDDRLQLQQRCRQLVSLGSVSRVAGGDSKLESIAEQPESEACEDAGKASGN